MLTIEERDIVVASMRKYPKGFHTGSWGKSPEFNFDNNPKSARQVEELEDSILLAHG